MFVVHVYSYVASVNIPAWSGTMEIRAASLWNIRYAAIDLTDLYMYFHSPPWIRRNTLHMREAEIYTNKNDWGS